MMPLLSDKWNSLRRPNRRHLQMFGFIEVKWFRHYTKMKCICNFVRNDPSCIEWDAKLYSLTVAVTTTAKIVTASLAYLVLNKDHTYVYVSRWDTDGQCSSHKTSNSIQIISTLLVRNLFNDLDETRCCRFGRHNEFHYQWMLFIPYVNSSRVFFWNTSTDFKPAVTMNLEKCFNAYMHQYVLFPDKF